MPEGGTFFCPIVERCIPWRFRASLRQIAISQIALSAGKQWTSGIQARFRSTSSFIGLKMPNQLRWGRREQAHLARLMTISPNSQIVTARATFFRPISERAGCSISMA